MATFFQGSAAGEMQTVQTGPNYRVSAGSTLILIHLMTPWCDSMPESEREKEMYSTKMGKTTWKVHL